jgi:phage tail sheath protein FI
MNGKLRVRSTIGSVFIASAVLLVSVLLVPGAIGATKTTTLPSKTNGDVNTVLTRENAVLTKLRAFQHLGKNTSLAQLESQLKSAEAAQANAIAALNSDFVVKKPTTATSTMTQQQKSAAEEANQYLSTEAFSRQGLIDQLDSPNGGGYSVSDATVAVDSLTTNWNTEAVQAAKEYLKTEPFSCNDLIQQLDSPEGGEFTVAQATYGAQQSGDC